MRARFEETRKEKDMRKLAAMVEAGEEEIFQNQAVAPFIYKNDEGGITYNRQAHIEDQVLNDWHPWEKVSKLETDQNSIAKNIGDFTGQLHRLLQ